jgi:hypothetical protein
MTSEFTIVFAIIIIFFIYIYVEMMVNFKTTQFFYTRTYIIEKTILQGGRDGFVEFHLKRLFLYKTSPNMKSTIKYLKKLHIQNKEK